MFPPLPTKRYSIIYADPPWFYATQQHAGPGMPPTGGSETHYDTVKLDDLKGLDVGSFSEPNSLLFMWACSPLLDQALELGEAWGFKYVTVAFCWNKIRVNPGNYTMSQVELCLVFKRGTIPTPRGIRNARQYVEEKRGKHSVKPDEVRNRISLMFPSHEKIELFARKQSPGWDAWGKEA